MDAKFIRYPVALSRRTIYFQGSQGFNPIGANLFCCKINRTMAFGISAGANGLRPEGARELSPGFTLGLGVTPGCREGAGISYSIAEEHHHVG
jgi:hypothetical protein